VAVTVITSADIGNGLLIQAGKLVAIPSNDPGNALTLGSDNLIYLPMIYTDRFAPYQTALIDEATVGTTYVLKAHDTDATLWLIIKTVEAGTDTTLTYAGIGNNPTLTPATAWSARTTLVYGAPSQA
jgi:hypothetical protein